MTNVMTLEAIEKMLEEKNLVPVFWPGGEKADNAELQYQRFSTGGKLGFGTQCCNFTTPENVIKYQLEPLNGYKVDATTLKVERPNDS